MPIPAIKIYPTSAYSDAEFMDRAVWWISRAAELEKDNWGKGVMMPIAPPDAVKISGFQACAPRRQRKYRWGIPPTIPDVEEKEKILSKKPQ